MSTPLLPSRVLLDALALGERPAGVGRYVTTLLQGIAELGLRGQVALVARADVRPGLAGAGWETLGPGRPGSRLPWRPLWEQLGLPLLAHRRRFDLIHGLMAAVPFASPTPRVVTIHDVTFLTHPWLHQPVKVAYFRALLPLAARAARLVITDSSASAGELTRALSLDPQRIRVVPLAVDPGFAPAAPADVLRVRAAHGLKRPYLLYAGVLEPRKNLPVLIDAVSRLRARGYPHVLALAGKPGWGLAPIERAIAAAGDAVQRLGWVAEADLPALLSGADAFVYVPLAEGFGLPVAEALACGVPVITSDRSSLPEVAGGAAVLVDPEDADAVASGVARVLDDPVLRADLAHKGLARAADLNPRTLAEGTIAVYRSALASS